MNSGIIIKTELQQKGSWIKISIPMQHPGAARATVSSAQGTVIKTVMLEQGNNAIDISGIAVQSLLVKVETAFETILRNIKLTEG